MATEERIIGIPFDFTIGTTAGQAYVEKYTLTTGYDFLWEYTLCSFRNTNGVPDSVLSPSIRDVLINIRDEATKEDMFVSSVYLRSIAGFGFSPFIFTKPYIFKAGTTITVTVIDQYGGTEGFHLQVLLQGRAIFK